MPLIRFAVTALFAWMLIRATFANTVTWRHPHAVLETAAHPDAGKRDLATQRLITERGARVAKNT